MDKYDVIVIGGGPAGLTSALYAARAGRNVLVLEGGICGGQIAFSPEVENYPGFMNISGAEFAGRLMEQAEHFGAVIEYNKAKDIIKSPSGEFTVVTETGEYTCRTVIIASGARCRNAGVPGEEEYKGRGVSYCALCDGAFYKGRDVAVIGGGNTALEDAVYLSEICNKVYLIHRREEFRAEPALIARLDAHDNIIPMYSRRPVSINGGETVEMVELESLKDNTREQIAVDGVFVAVGRVPDTDFVSGILERDERGYIRAGEDCITGVPGIFAAGDCRNRKVKQLTTAVADGTAAAVAAVEFLRRDV